MTGGVGSARGTPLRRALRTVRGLLWPRRCPFCGRVLGGVPECEACRAEREELLLKPTLRLSGERHYLGRLSGAAAVFDYRGCVRGAVLRAKYHGEEWTARELGLCAAASLFGADIGCGLAEPDIEPLGYNYGYDCVVPVPPTSRARGYNVPELIARPIAEALGIPLESGALRRVRTERRQAQLSMEQRLENAAGAFAAADTAAIDGRRVLLVDDVITTGATVSACAQALLDAGAESVFAVSVAAAAGPFEKLADEKGEKTQNNHLTNRF